MENPHKMTSFAFDLTSGSPSLALAYDIPAEKMHTFSFKRTPILLSCIEGADPGFLERGSFCIKRRGFALLIFFSFFLNVP